jgi:hypothetical protein
MQRFLTFATAMGVFGLTLQPAVHAETTSMDFSYDDWQTVLEAFVDDKGFVDYDGLRGDRATLDRFLEQLRTHGPTTTPELFPEREDQLAYYINAYNALVFGGVLGLDPDASTVWGFTKTGYGFFVRMKVELDGQKMSLKKLEDDLVREGFKDPRIHAALNCASADCPRLPQEPFLPATLDEQLEAAMEEFIGEERNCSVDNEARTVTLSKIFDWFRGDFEDYPRPLGEGGGDLLGYINRYRPADAQISTDFKIEFATYDKSLNKQ